MSDKNSLFLGAIFYNSIMLLTEFSMVNLPWFRFSPCSCISRKIHLYSSIKHFCPYHIQLLTPHACMNIIVSPSLFPDSWYINPINLHSFFVCYAIIHCNNKYYDCSYDKRNCRIHPFEDKSIYKLPNWN